MGPIHHVEISVSDLERSCRFYGAVLRALEWTELKPGAYIKEGCEIYLQRNDTAKSPGSGPRHLCLRAESRDAVHRVASALAALGTQVLRGPQAMPQYSPTYYTLDFRDPDGFVLEVAHD